MSTSWIVYSVSTRGPALRLSIKAVIAMGDPEIRRHNNRAAIRHYRATLMLIRLECRDIRAESRRILFVGVSIVGAVERRDVKGNCLSESGP
jgi:hypothetical protein